jgi:hypothetical protein
MSSVKGRSEKTNTEAEIQISIPELVGWLSRIVVFTLYSSIVLL